MSRIAIMRSLGSAVLALVAGTAPSLAQGQTATGDQKPVPLTFSGSLRTRMEAWDWFKGNADGTYAYSGSILRGSMGQQRKNLDWQLEMAVPILLGLPDSAIAPGAQGQFGLGATYYAANDRSRNTALPFLKQGFVRFKGLGGNAAHSLRLGRMELVDATEVLPKSATLSFLKRDRLGHRLVGTFAFAHVGRSFDGVQYAYNKDRNNFTFFAVKPTRGVFQTDGWGELNAVVLYGAYTRQTGADKSTGDLRLFGIYYDDWRKNVVKTDNRPLAVRRADRENVRLATVGGHYIHAIETRSGTVDLLFWGALQGGRWGIQDHRAGAVALEGGYQPAIWPKLRPWFRGGYFFGSGDGNPNDSTHATFFQILPTPRIYARFPIYNLMNNEDAFGHVSLRPGPRWNFRTEIHALRLADPNDLWYQGGGAFQPWTFGYVGRPSGGNRGMATVFDAGFDFQIQRNVTLSAYFANAWGRQVIESIYRDGKSARFGYLELLYRF